MKMQKVLSVIVGSLAATNFCLAQDASSSDRSFSYEIADPILGGIEANISATDTGSVGSYGMYYNVTLGPTPPPGQNQTCTISLSATNGSLTWTEQVSSTTNTNGQISVTVPAGTITAVITGGNAGALVAGQSGVQVVYSLKKKAGSSSSQK